MKRRLAIALIMFASTAAHVGLAILGWGSTALFFADRARSSLMVALLVLTALASFSSGNLSVGVREDRANRWVLIPFLVISLLAAYLPAYTDRVDFLTLDGGVVRWIGVVLFTGGGFLRLWPVFVLGQWFSGLVAIQPGHALVTRGVYRLIRHPSYLGLLVSSLGWGLAFRSAVGVMLTLLLIPPLVARMRAEERLLREHFGVEYDAYCVRTSRLLPGVY